MARIYGAYGYCIKRNIATYNPVSYKGSEWLNKAARAIGAIYTMITGKEVVVRSNGIADSAFDAAEGEEELADGIEQQQKQLKRHCTIR